MMVVVIATRIHLGKATELPANLDDRITSFAKFCGGEDDDGAHVDDDASSILGVIAVDAEERIPGYDLVESVRAICSKFDIHVLPVQPWGKFVPALNALVQFACSCPMASQILFVSAETTAPRNATLATLQSHLKDDTMVVGAVLPGHDHRGVRTEIMPLTGRTSPWNTLALWDLSKISRTGFQLVSEGLDDSSMAGVEEVAAIALLQSLFPNTCKAKLVQVQGVNWEQEFADPARQQWHENKMASKVERPAHQLASLGLHNGTVEHIVSEVQGKKLRFVVTGFGPFDTFQVNPTELICQHLKNRLLNSNSGIDSSFLETIVIETSAEAAREAIADIYAIQNSEHRTVVLHLGLNYRGTSYELEQFAYNNASFRVPDQRGFQPQRELIVDEWPLEEYLETKFDVRLLAEEMSNCFKEPGTIVSDDPGRFVCNYTYYQSLAMAQDRTNTLSLFLHIPNVPHLRIDEYLDYVETLLVFCGRNA